VPGLGPRNWNETDVNTISKTHLLSLSVSFLRRWSYKTMTRTFRGEGDPHLVPENRAI
jgi:hypothetical protein